MRLFALFLACAALPAFAVQDDEAARAERWKDSRGAILGKATVQDAAGAVTLDAPDRALDAALVPVTVRLNGAVKALYLVVDDNPSPLAAAFHFGPAADPRELRTRVRVDDYTYIHAVAEMADGRFLATRKFVKASGGCSAPSAGDPQEAMNRLGRMKLKPAGDGPAGGTQVQLLISHPNFNGMQMDQVSRLYTPARFIQDVKVTEGGRLVFDLAADISMSEDPSISFGVKPEHSVPLTVDVTDSTNAKFHRSFDLPAVATN